MISTFFYISRLLWAYVIFLMLSAFGLLVATILIHVFSEEKFENTQVGDTIELEEYEGLLGIPYVYAKH